MRTVGLMQNTVHPSSGIHQVAVELPESRSRSSATAQVRLALDQVELDWVRSYLVDHPECPTDRAPAIAAQVEVSLATLSRELFGQVFEGPRGDPAVGLG